MKVKVTLDNPECADRYEFLVFPNGNTKDPVPVSILGEDHYDSKGKFVSGLHHATERLKDMCCERDSKGRVIPSSLRFQVVRRIIPDIQQAA